MNSSINSERINPLEKETPVWVSNELLEMLKATSMLCNRLNECGYVQKEETIEK